MRISIKFEVEEEELKLPVHYNHILQAFIYENLDNSLASFLHDKGFISGKRHFKMFTFSRLFPYGKPVLKNGFISMKSPVYFKMASINEEVLESFAVHLIKKREFTLYRQKCRFSSIEVEMPLRWKGEILIRAISPITVYSTLHKRDGSRKTYYYTPWERDFAALIKNNLVNKAKALGIGIEKEELKNFVFEPHKVSKKDEAIIKFKGTWIKGWLGTYRMVASETLFDIAFNAGIGGKNSQGFGMLDLGAVHI